MNGKSGYTITIENLIYALISHAVSEAYKVPETVRKAYNNEYVYLVQKLVLQATDSLHAQVR